MIYYNYLETAVFEDGNDVAFLDKYRYKMCAPAYAVKEDIMIPALELGKIWAPDMKTILEDDKACFSMDDITVKVVADSPEAAVSFQKIKLVNPCKMIDGILYVPVGQIMHMAYGKTLRWSGDINTLYSSKEEKGMFMYGFWPLPTPILAVSSDPEYKLDNYALHYIQVVDRGKPYGEQYMAFWLESAGKIVTYSAYIPTTYNPEMPSRMVVFLHGGSIYVGDKYAFKYGEGRLQEACEKYNYIVLCANSVNLLSGFGGKMFAAEGVSDEEREYYKMADDSLMYSIELMKQKYNIDEDHMYLMGNSMGGGATYSVAQNHPGIFRAIACGGAGPRAFTNDMSLFIKTPSIILAGTEDEFGYDSLLASYRGMKEFGGDVELATVAGGTHLQAWSYALDKAFDFYARH